MLPTVIEFLEDTKDERVNDNVKSKIINNHQSLGMSFGKYFPDIKDDLTFGRNPYLVVDTKLASMFSGDDNNKEKFITSKNDSTREDAKGKGRLCLHSDHPWYLLYPRDASAVISPLMAFLSIWLREAVFTAQLTIKDKARNEQTVDLDQSFVLATTALLTYKLVAKIQGQPSRRCCLEHEFSK